MNFESSDSKISKKSENNNIADNTGNHKEQIHLHGTNIYLSLGYRDADKTHSYRMPVKFAQLVRFRFYCYTPYASKMHLSMPFLDERTQKLSRTIAPAIPPYPLIRQTSK